MSSRPDRKNAKKTILSNLWLQKYVWSAYAQRATARRSIFSPRYRFGENRRPDCIFPLLCNGPLSTRNGVKPAIVSNLRFSSDPSREFKNAPFGAFLNSGADLSRRSKAKTDDRIAAPPCKIRPLGEPALFRLFATVRTGCFAGSNPDIHTKNSQNAHNGAFCKFLGRTCLGVAKQRRMTGLYIPVALQRAPFHSQRFHCV